MSYIPLNYDKLNVACSSYTPSSIKAYNNNAYRFWERALFQRATSVIEFKNLPNEWVDKMGVTDFLYYCLFKFGYVAVTDKLKEYGIMFQPCNISGINLYYQPTTAIISNPAITKPLKLEIGKDCELIKLTPDYLGIYDIISYYAEQLALIDCSINTSIINSKIPYILGAKNKSCAEGIKLALDKVNRGEPAVVYDRKMSDNQDDLSGKQSPFQQVKLFTVGDYITDKLMTDRNAIIQNFDREIGIPTLPYEKTERLIVSEVSTAKSDGAARLKVWMKSLEESIDNVNKLYNLNISVEHSYEKEYNTMFQDESGRPPEEDGDVNG